jgi:hypothetical protein
MGATVTAYWPGITEDQIDSTPDFWNDHKAFGNWMANREENPAAMDAIRKLNAAAILSHKTDGGDDDDVTWVSPAQLRDAATKLREAVQAKLPETDVILKTYEIDANGIDPIADEFIQDLNDVIAIANWAEKEGATKMTLEVNW